MLLQFASNNVLIRLFRFTYVLRAGWDIDNTLSTMQRQKLQMDPTLKVSHQVIPTLSIASEYFFSLVSHKWERAFRWCMCIHSMVTRILHSSMRTTIICTGELTLSKKKDLLVSDFFFLDWFSILRMTMSDSLPFTCVSLTSSFFIHYDSRAYAISQFSSCSFINCPRILTIVSLICRSSWIHWRP